MNILDEIIQHKRKEVEESKGLYPVRLLEKSIYFTAEPVSLKKYLRRTDKSGVIAEFKRKSPSKGIINAHAQIERTSIGYMQAGASALSVLTDKNFFGGSNQDLTTARKFNFCPILRKEFIVDEYQIVEAKSIGADAILLIAAVLDKSTLRKFTDVAKKLGMEVLTEVHDASELEKSIDSGTDLIGVNNRNLKTFEVSLEVSKNLVSQIPPSIAKVSESGISSPNDIKTLKQFGYEGFLIGENFMKHSRPELAAKEFIQQLT